MGELSIKKMKKNATSIDAAIMQHRFATCQNCGRLGESALNADNSMS